MEQPRLEPYLGEEKPLVPPKSLGEECIEIGQDATLSRAMGHEFGTTVTFRTRGDTCTIKGPLVISRKDIQEMRERLWDRPHWGGRALVDLADPTLEASILFLRETHINPYKWRP